MQAGSHHHTTPPDPIVVMGLEPGAIAVQTRLA